MQPSPSWSLQISIAPPGVHWLVPLRSHVSTHRSSPVPDVVPASGETASDPVFTRSTGSAHPIAAPEIAQIHNNFHDFCIEIPR